jgi:hypothetical protein
MIFSFFTKKVYKLRRFPPVDILEQYIDHKPFVVKCINVNPNNRPTKEEFFEYTKK